MDLNLNSLSDTKSGHQETLAIEDSLSDTKSGHQETLAMEEGRSSDSCTLKAFSSLD